MSKFIVSVETTADLGKELFTKYDIKEAGMNFYIDGQEFYTGNSDMTPSAFFDKMKSGSKVSTSQINVYQAKEFFTELLKEGKDILHLSFSSALSGCYNNMKTVAEELNKTSKNKIIVIDSLCASAGQGLLAIYASENADKFETIEEFAQYMENIKLKICHLFVVDSLKYLSRTGRISKITAAIGSVLQIKPVLHVDDKGFLTSMSKVISRKKSIINISEKLSAMKTNEYDKILIAHANCMDDALMLQNLIEKSQNIKAEILDLGYVIGAHSGPGTLAVFFTSKER